MAEGGRTTACPAKICTSTPPQNVARMSPDSRHWDHPLADYSFASSSAVFGKNGVSPHPTSSSLPSLPAQKPLPQEHTGTVTSQTRWLHLQSLSDLSSAIKADLFVPCWLPSLPLLQHTLKRLGGKASTWSTFLFPTHFGPPPCCVFQFALPPAQILVWQTHVTHSTTQTWAMTWLPSVTWSCHLVSHHVVFLVCRDGYASSSHPLFAISLSSLLRRAVLSKLQQIKTKLLETSNTRKASWIQWSTETILDRKMGKKDKPF